VIDIIRHPRNTSGRRFPVDLKELHLPPGTRIQDGSREFSTVICCICADGSYLDSAIIMKAQNGMQDSCSQTSTMSLATFYSAFHLMVGRIIARHLLGYNITLGPGSATEIKAAGEWRMLWSV
jgi:hypothetical protein